MKGVFGEVANIGIPLLGAVLVGGGDVVADLVRCLNGKGEEEGLYRESRKMVRGNPERLNAEIHVLRRQLRNINNQSVSNKIGDVVVAYIERVLSHTGFSINDVRYDGTPIALDDLRTEPFWQKYGAGEANLSFTYRTPYRNLQVSELPPRRTGVCDRGIAGPFRVEALDRTDIQSKINATR